LIGRDGATHGFVLSDDALVRLDAPGASATIAMDINATGQIVGLQNDVAGSP
jgi:hypothetical protein